ncbi:FliO/MopB family protein [Candidatus Latescibacterota bacterium]
MWSTVKVVVALGLTLVLLVAAVWIFKKILTLHRVPGFSDGAITFLEVRYITPKKGIALVRVLQRIYIIGFSEQALTTLGELTQEEVEILEREKNSTDRAGVFKNILSGIIGNKTVKSGGISKGT